MGALRLFLAFGVFLLHFNEQVLAPQGMAAPAAWAGNLLGGRAVLLFYVVSGFLISHVLHAKYPPTAPGTAAFWRARVLRIYPLWWVVLLVCLATAPPGWQGGLAPALLFGADWLVAFAHYPRPHWSLFPPGAEIGWALGAELTFYALAPWLLRSPRRVALALAGSVLLRGVLLASFAPAEPGFKSWSYLFFPAVLCFFLLGHLAEALGRRYPPGRGMLLASLGLVVAGATQLDASTEVGSPWFHLAALGLAGALPGVFAATRHSAVSTWLGRLTYPLYLTHCLVLGLLFTSPAGAWMLRMARPFAGSALASGALVLATLALALGVAVLAHHALEEPLRRAGARLLRAAPAWRSGDGG